MVRGPVARLRSAESLEITGVSMSERIEAVVRTAIARQAQIEESAVQLDSTLEELGVTSLDLVEIIMTVEDEYDVTVPLDANEAWNAIKSVRDIVELGRTLGIEGA
jgi:acyl carrier protein